MKLPRAGATLAIGDAEIDTAHAIYQDIRAGKCDALHMQEAEISWSEHTLCLTLPKTGVTIRLCTDIAEPRLERSLARENFTRGTVTFFDTEALERYVQTMEQIEQPVPPARAFRASEFLLQA